MSRVHEVEKTIITITRCAVNYRVESDILQRLCRTLAAENAELRNEVERWKEGTNHEMIMGDSARKRLFAANATLDALREVCNQNEWDRAQKGDMLSQFRAILWPKPKETNDENH